MKQAFPLLGILILAWQLTAQANPMAPRVALMDFVSDDNSCRSAVAMENLGAELQAEISGDTNYDWVDRAELEKSVNEFRLAGSGLLDRSDAIQSGRWAKADWGVFGDVSTNIGGNRILELEVVNLQRADVLAATNVALPDDNGPFQIKAESEPQILAALRRLLDRARGMYRASEKQNTVALLFLTLGERDDDAEEGDIATDFRHALVAASEKGQQFHVVQFQRAETSIDEANLVLSGLAETDSNAVEQVADHYVWGQSQFNEQRVFHWESQTLVDEKTLAVKLNVWDGRTEPRVINLTWTNATSEAVAQQLIQVVEPMLHRTETSAIVEDVHKRISDAILASYKGLPNFSFGSPERRRQWADAVQLLETACFFNPGNAAAREQLLRLRWGTSLSGTDAGKDASSIEHMRLEPLMLAAALEENSRNKFFFVQRRSEAWGKYVEQFGLTSALAKPELPSIATEYVLAAWQPFEMFQYAQENLAQWGVPRDAGLPEMTQWENQLGSNFVARLLQVPKNPALAPRAMEFFYHALSISDLPTRKRMIEQYWPKILEQAQQSPIGFTDERGYLRRYFSDIGQPEGEQKLLAQLEAANQAGGARQAAAAPPRRVQLPRLADVEPALTKSFFSVPRMTFPPPLVKPELRAISFPAGVEVSGIKGMAFHKDTLWLVISVVEPVRIDTVNGQIEKQFQPVTEVHNRLWRLRLDASQPEPVPGCLATNEVNSLMFAGDTLWLALGDGIAAWNVKTGSLQRYDSATENVGRSQLALANTSQGIAVLGDIGVLTFLDRATGTWRGFRPALPPPYGGYVKRIAGLNDKLLYDDGQTLLCDLATNTWTRIFDPQTCKQIGRVHCLTSDGNRYFWMASDAGLHQVDADTGHTKSQWVPTSPTIQTARDFGYPMQPPIYKPSSELMEQIEQELNWRRQMLDNTNASNLFVPSSRLESEVLSTAVDDEFLWVLTAVHPWLYHPASQSWVGGFSLEGVGRLVGLACGGGKLWLANQNSIFEMDAGKLKSLPRANWLADTIAPNELNARLSSLSMPERAVYAFFSGNDAAAVALLKNQPEDDLDAESLFLLYSCFTEMGETNHASQLKQRLNQTFPDSELTKVANIK